LACRLVRHTMKLCIAAVFLHVANSAGISLKAEADARVWLLDHPDGDDLTELKNANPDAYALVKALLTKRSLGLLDPRHPTASFAAAPVRDDGDRVSGAAAFAKLATTSEEKQALQANVNMPFPAAHSSGVALPFPDTQAQSHNWLNWKPTASGMDDESMVRNVLGAVADLTKGKSLRGNQQSDDASSSFTSAVEAEASKEEQPSTTMSMTAAPVSIEAHQNSYLKSFDLAPSPKVQQQESTGENALTSFTWDDASKVQTTTAKVVKGSKENLLASWLGFKPHVQTAAPVAEHKLSNPYLVDLQ